MIYIFEDEAGKNTLSIKGELFKYLIKVRRHAQGDKICFRSRRDIKTLHTYELLHVDPRSIELSLLSSNIQEVKASIALHVGWCVIDTKSVEKVLPSLCEIGVDKISFISCDKSQRNFKADFKRFERILEASMQQSGRSSYMEFSTCRDIETFVEENPDTKVFDFCPNVLEDKAEFKTVLIGCEGGFSTKERDILKTKESFRLNSPMVLRSESAVMAVASKILL